MKTNYPAHRNAPSKFRLLNSLAMLTVVMLCGLSTTAQVAITKPNLAISVCSGFPSSYNALGNIVIAESANANFTAGTNITLELTAPTNFEFQALAGNVAFTASRNITSATIAVTTTTATITYSVSGVNKLDTMTLSGLLIRAMNTPTTGNITRTSGSGVINGLVNGTTLTNALSSSTGSPPTTANAGSNQILTACTTTTSVTANVPTVGTGMWSVVSGTASITSPGSATTAITGLVLGTTATLRWTISNSPCSPSTSDITITTSLGSGCVTYCASSGGTIADGITGVTINTLNNTGSVVNVAYSDYTALSTNLTKGLSYNLNVYVNTGGNFTNYQSVWIDWNSDGDFVDAGEFYNAGTATNVTNNASSLCPLAITVPLTAVTATVRMRVQSRYNAATTGSCQTGFDGETEDYSLNLLAPSPCATPTAQPTAIVLTTGSVDISATFTAASPAPNNYLVVMNTTGIVPSPVNGTSYTVGGTVGAGNSVVDTDSNTSFTASGLTILTTYYFYIFSYNSACSGGPLFYTTTPATANTTTLAVSYCTPTGNLDCLTSNDYIANVTINTLNNSTTCAPTAYTNFPPTGTQTTTLTRGNTYNFSMTSGPGNKKHGAGVWIDFNKNSVFDAAEYFSLGNGIIASSATTVSIPVPVGATLGTTRMRVRYGRQTNVTSASACTMAGTRGETEDYTITIADPIACVAPTTQPTALILNSTGTTIAGSFTAPSPAPNNYLVVINTTGIAPSPVNTTAYTIGGTIGAGNTVVDIDSNAAFLATGLSASTTYYLFVFSFNSACAGGPVYNTLSPLTGSIATIVSNYCAPSVSSGQQSLGYFSEVSFVGTLNDVSNYSTYSSAPIGYQDFTALTNLAIQAQGEGVNISVQALNSSFMKAWVDWNKDGDFTDTGELVYNTGGISTYSSTFGFIIPSAQPVGNYRIRIRLNSRDFSFPYDANSTDAFTSCGNINYPGETEDYLFTVISKCTALIATVTDGRTCGPGTVALDATSASPGVTQFRWYTTPTGATLVGSTPTGSWTTPSISATTTYYVTAYNGCESLVRTAVTATVSPIPALNYTPTSPIVCGEDVVINLSATGDAEEVFLIDEKFLSGLGTFTNTNILSTTENATSQWQNKTSTFVPTPVTNYNVWFPAISSGVNGNGFAMSTSDVGGPIIHNQMASASVNSTNFLNLFLTFRMFYSRYYEDGQYLPLDYVTVDVSTNGGGAWTEVMRYTEDIGIGTRFETMSFNLSAFTNQPNLKVRVRYYGEWCDGLAVDDIKLFGYRPISTALTWTSATPVNAFADPACTIPYVAGTPAVNVYVKPTLVQLEQGTYTFTANATLANGCATSQDIVVTNNSKIWLGLTTDWNDPNNWRPAGVPTSTNCVIIPSPSIISGSGYNAYAKNLTVKPTGTLTVQSANNITVTDAVSVNSGGQFNLQNSSSLVQITDTAVNTGNIQMTRTSRPMTRWAYVYYGSPVVENVAAQIPSVFDIKYKWNSGTQTGNWSGLSSTTQGEGFIARVKNIAPFSTGTGTIDFTFIGTPANGVVNVPVNSYDSSSLVGGNTVLLANPYPSALNAATFLQDPNNTELGGTLFFWTNITTYSGSGIYNTQDYGTWNLTGGVGTAPATDPTNLSLKPNGKIAAGQGFFAQAFADGSISFKNNMRTTDFNTQFFRTTSVESGSHSEGESSRLWLNLYNEDTFRQMLVGYIDGATDDFDRLYDGDSFTNNPLTVYSIVSGRNLVIQGKALPFDQSDIIPIGFKVPTAGTYTIAVDETDGIFSGTQKIYLKDKLLNVIHALNDAPYSFETNAGTDDGRFEITFIANTLAVSDFDHRVTTAFIAQKQLHIQSSVEILKVEVYDLGGKMIYLATPLEMKTDFDTAFQFPEGIYVTKIQLADGTWFASKLSNKN